MTKTKPTCPFDHVRMLHSHEHTDDLTGYAPFIIRRALSFTKDTILYANEMNLNYDLDPKLQYRLSIQLYSSCETELDP